MRLSAFFLFFALYFLGFSAMAQSDAFVLSKKSGSDKIRFQLLNNLIIIPVEVNGVPLSFILDTGVSKPILFNLYEGEDIVNTKQVSTIHLKGLGEGEYVEAVKSQNNKIKIGEVTGLNQTVYAAYNTGLDYSPKLGIPIHGIIGYDLFKDFVVEINYQSKYIKIKTHDSYKEKICKSCEIIDLTFYHGKPHIEAKVAIKDDLVPIHVLLDTGASDALWLFEDASKDLVSSNDYIDDFLGYGLSGSLYGKRSRVESVNIKGFELNKSLVAFPEGASIEALQRNSERNGTIGGEILKRFNMIFNYANQTLILKKNKNFNSRFTYNMSGIDLEQRGFRLIKNYQYNLDNGRLTFGKDVTNFVTNKASSDYRLNVKPAFQIVKLRDNSPAKKAGLLAGDIIIKVNHKDIKDYSLQEVIESLNSKSGKKMTIEVDRNGRLYEYSFILTDVI